MTWDKLTEQYKFSIFFACLAATTLTSTSCGLPIPSSNNQEIKAEPKKVPIEVSLKKRILIETETGTKKVIGYESIILNPSQIGIQLYSGWNRENEANKDKLALAFISGPTFELRQDPIPHGYIAHGDIKGENGLFLSMNKTAAKERGYVSINNKGQAKFGYGTYLDTLKKDARVFIGGLHVLTNHTISRPITYKGVYKDGLSLADVRIVYGLRPDGRIEIVETDDGVYVQELASLVEKLKFKAAYLPDHASKTRLIIPFKRIWTESKAAWVSGGKPSITQMPFMIKIVSVKEKIDKPPQTSWEYASTLAAKQLRTNSGYYDKIKKQFSTFILSFELMRKTINGFLISQK